MALLENIIWCADWLIGMKNIEIFLGGGVELGEWVGVRFGKG